MPDFSRGGYAVSAPATVSGPAPTMQGGVLGVGSVSSPVWLRERVRRLILLADTLDHECRGLADARQRRFAETQLADREVRRLRASAEERFTPADARVRASAELEAAQIRLRMCRADDTAAQTAIAERSALRTQARQSLQQILGAIPDGGVQLAQTESRL